MDNAPIDQGSAVAELERAAALGDLSAKFHLAHSYWNSTTWRDDLHDEESAEVYKRKALDLFLEVARTGDPYAAAEVGTFFHEGIAGRRDLARARHWYERAAKGGLANPAWRLAWMYEHGTGVRVDLREAYKWLDVGTRLWSLEPTDGPQIALRRDALGRRMSPAQVQQAQARSGKWLESLRPLDDCYRGRKRFRFAATVDDHFNRDFSAWIPDVERQLDAAVAQPPCSNIEGRAVVKMTVWPDGHTSDEHGGDGVGIHYFSAAVGAAIRRLKPGPLPEYPKGRYGATLVVTAFFNEEPLPALH